MKKKVNAAILIIGNEILSGRTQDKNIAFISSWLNTKCGISVNEVRIIPDIEKIIIENVLLLSKKFNYLFTNSPDINLFSKSIYIYYLYEKKSKCCNFNYWQ